jgi:hypothetical protein
LQSDEGSKHIDNCPMILIGFPHDAFEGIDAANPLHRITRELVHSFGKTICHLAFPLGR